MTNGDNKKNALAINQVQLLLAEKRTSLAVLRTGIAVLALPLSVISFLVVTSEYYNVTRVFHFLIPLGILNLVLITFGVWLIYRSISRMKHYDHMIHEIKEQNSEIGQFID